MKAPNRPSVTCRHFGRCGGCTTLDQRIEDQLRSKREQILAAVGPQLDGAPLTMSEPPRGAPLYARNRVALPVHPDAKLGLVAGLYERGSHDIIELAECRTQHQSLTRFGKIAIDLARSMNLEAYDERRHTGLVRAFLARVFPSTGELLIGLVTTDAPFPRQRKFAERLRTECGRLRDARGQRLTVTGVVHNRNSAPGNALLGPATTPLLGRAWQRDRVRFEEAPAGTLSFRVSFDSFYQLHQHSDRLLYRPALDMIGDVRGLRIVDAYGGVGTFGIRLATRGARSVQIVEAHPAACRDATDNVRRNGVEQSTAVHHVPFGEFEADGRPVDWLVVDPPRAGLGAAGLARVASLRPARILHVACSLRALSRDLEGLREQEYTVTAAHCADLFPHTEHVEVVVALTKKAREASG